jgi:hypothetical protein
MSDKKQTPIDYIRDNLFYPIQLNQLKRVLNEAEQMHKEQIKDARDSYINQMLKVNDDLLIYGEAQYKEMTSEEYYNETYGK